MHDRVQDRVDDTAGVRDRLRRRWLLPALLLAFLLFTHPARAHEHEEPYRDIRGHWAQPWIEVLWEEGVTDGFRIRTRRGRKTRWQSRFLPDREIQLDAWTVLAAKVFALPPAENARRHYLPGGQEVGGWLRAALAAGWLTEPHDWERAVSRESAVRFLLEALGLGDYARGLAASSVEWTLSRYRDWRRITPSARPYVAAATRLGITEGYPDRTFQPERRLTRAEAATLLGRSALARAEAAPNPFYPDGDGVDDETRFTLATLRNRNLSRWSLVIEDAAGKPLWSTGTGAGRAPAPPATVRWDGRSQAGIPLPAATYYYRFQVWDGRGQVFESVRKPLVLDRRRLDGGLSPSVLQPGEAIAVWAVTAGEPTRVTAEVPALLPEARALELREEDGGSARWSLGQTIPATAAPGAYTLLMRAEFPGTERRLPLTFFVRDPVFLTAELDPVRLPAGATLTVTARASANIERVVAHPPGADSLPLDRLQATSWRGTWLVPLDTPPGRYEVRVVADSPYGPRSVLLEFEVEGDVRETLRVILTD